MATLDIAGLRAATPGCVSGIHLNHAGASLPSTATLAAITDHLRREALHGPMEAAAEVQDRLDQARRDAATLLNACPEEIAFASSGSAAFGLSFAAMAPLRAGDRILVGRHEWGGNLSTFRSAADAAGATIDVIPCRQDGTVDADALSKMLDNRVRLVSLTWAPANGGIINDAAAIGCVTRAAGIPYFIDAGQALGQLPIDVEALGCDVLKGAGRKYLRGPRGTALLYVRSAFRRTLKPAFLDVLSGPWTGEGPQLRDDARIFEASEMPVALLLGLGNAIREALDLGVPAIRERIAAFAGLLRQRLAELPAVTLRDLGTDHSGLVSFTINGIDVQEVRARLATRRIAVGANGPAYTPLDMRARDLPGVIRASVSYLNTEDELERLVTAVNAIARGE